jgi:hypothetical protein
LAVSAVRSAAARLPRRRTTRRAALVLLALLALLALTRSLAVQ